jgi:hypothetical protein
MKGCVSLEWFRLSGKGPVFGFGLFPNWWSHEDHRGLEEAARDAAEMWCPFGDGFAYAFKSSLDTSAFAAAFRRRGWNVGVEAKSQDLLILVTSPSGIGSISDWPYFA